MKPIDEKTREEVIAWLKEFAKMVRANDYSKAESLFDQSTFGFGTVAPVYSSLDEYRSLQWKECWAGTKDFEFNHASLKCAEDEKEGFIVVGILWTGIGIRQNGEEFPRDGRATIVYRRDKEMNSLVSIHNHYSRTPKNFPEDF